ncbi:Suppressor of the cold-sensitive snRNP bioproteinsis mutant brr1-1, variant 2, partial [Perkinsus olseni]
MVGSLIPINGRRRSRWLNRDAVVRVRPAPLPLSPFTARRIRPGTSAVVPLVHGPLPLVTGGTTWWLAEELLPHVLSFIVEVGENLRSLRAVCRAFNTATRLPQCYQGSHVYLSSGACKAVDPEAHWMKVLELPLEQAASITVGTLGVSVRHLELLSDTFGTDKVVRHMTGFAREVHSPNIEWVDDHTVRRKDEHDPFLAIVLGNAPLRRLACGDYYFAFRIAKTSRRHFGGGVTIALTINPPLQSIPEKLRGPDVTLAIVQKGEVFVYGEKIETRFLYWNASSLKEGDVVGLRIDREGSVTLYRNDRIVPTTAPLQIADLGVPPQQLLPGVDQPSIYAMLHVKANTTAVTLLPDHEPPHDDKFWLSEGHVFSGSLRSKSMKFQSNSIIAFIIGSCSVTAEKLESTAGTAPRQASVVGSEFQVENNAGSDGQDDIHAPYKLIITTEPNSGGVRRLASIEDHVRRLNNRTLSSQFTTLLNSIRSTKVLEKMSLEVLTLRDTSSYTPAEMCELFMEIQREVHGDDDGVFCGPDEIVYADATIPNDPSYNLQYHHALINAPQAWDVTTGDRSLVVALIDSGIDYSHPDLANNIWTNPGEIPNDGIDNDGNGYIDDVNGWDFHGDDANPMDAYGHGTHVGGILAAEGNNNRGVAGVAWKVSVAPLRFLNEKGQGYLSNALEAIDYAITMNIRMSVNSWSCTGCSVPTLETAVQRAGEAGHLFIASAGNKKNDNDATPTIPCGFNLDNIICVAATDANDVLLSNSNYGATTVDLAAPGGSIYSTKP